MTLPPIDLWLTGDGTRAAGCWVAEPSPGGLLRSLPLPGPATAVFGC
jgi:hypothetical protein